MLAHCRPSVNVRSAREATRFAAEKKGIKDAVKRRLFFPTASEGFTVPEEPRQVRRAERRYESLHGEK